MNSLRRPFLLSRRLCLAGGALWLSGCSRDGDDTDQPGAAFIDSQIPPGLSPEDYPPAGFVWSGFRHGALPEARYGVAAPPLNPRAHLLVLSDARYPAEIYFGLARHAIASNVCVWILEAPGQGGSGKYLMQNQDVFLPKYRDAVQTAEDFVARIIRPDAEKPLYIFAHGFAVPTARLLQTKDWPLKASLFYAPWTGEKIESPEQWRREDTPAAPWDQVAQRWRMANPDLRRVHLGQRWQEQMQAALKAADGFSLDRLTSATHTPVFISGTGASLQPLCRGQKTCQVRQVTDESGLGPVLTEFLGAGVQT
ncbi:MAG: hypothetical protein QM667_13165 [Asticcacaulis sp.]